MNSGMYAAVSGNIASMQRMEVITNNLANVNTVGFKKDRMLFDIMLDAANNLTPTAGTVTNGVPIISDYSFETDFSAGPLRQSGNPLDLALEGSGFFVVDTPDGKAYTRQGNFRLDGQGRIVTADGYAVQGSGGPITIKGGRVDINDKGEISVDGTQVGALAVVDFPKPYQLQKIGSAMFIPSTPDATAQPATGTRVSQGMLEESNVQSLEEMVDMIATTRFYESCIKTIQSFDEMANKAANDLGRV